MLPTKTVVPDAHHIELLNKKPGEIDFFNSIDDVQVATTPDSWVAIKASQPNRYGVLIEAVPPTGYTPDEWVQNPRLKKIIGLIAESVMSDIPSE